LNDERIQEMVRMENENNENKRAPRAPRDPKDNNTVFIGNKPFMNEI